MNEIDIIYLWCGFMIYFYIFKYEIVCKYFSITFSSTASAIIDASQPSNLAKTHAVNAKHDSPKPQQVTPVKPLLGIKTEGSSTHKVGKTEGSSTSKVAVDKKDKLNKTPSKELAKNLDHPNGKGMQKICLSLLSSISYRLNCYHIQYHFVGSKLVFIYFGITLPSILDS